MKKKDKKYLRKLDDQAKVFSLATSEKYSSIFRLSVVLKEKIEAKTLKKALKSVLKKYKAFKVKMKKGLFWYYFEENKKSPIIKIEEENLFKKINTKENNDYLFKVTYLKNKINIDFSHTLTDGNNGADFLKEVTYKYLELKHSKELKKDKKVKKVIFEDSENAYVKSYKKNTKKTEFRKKAYMIKGEELPKGKIGINYFNIKLDEIKKQAKEKGCSLSVYIIAMVAYSIYESNYKNIKKPINICVPVNLKKYFKSETISNFFSCMSVNFKLSNKRIYSFDDILELAKKEFEKKLRIEKIVETMTSEIGAVNNIFVKMVPLAIKKLVVRLGALEVKRRFTMTFSNIGKIEIDNKYSKYIENFLVVLAPDWAEKVKCSVSSYKDNLVVTFGTTLKNNLIEKKFKALLKEHNINFRLEGNCVSLISS